MNRKLIVSLFWVLCVSGALAAQVPVDVHVRILKFEDARRYDAELEKLITGNSPEPVLVRAMLAAGRIGDERAVPALMQRLGSSSPKVAEMAAFALGEIESMSAADAISQRIGETGKAQLPGRPTFDNRGRLAEAAGKIAAANAKDPKAKQLSDAIVFVLAAEKERQTSVETIRLALTAALRARPAGAEENIRFFLSHTDPNVVADALNTLARLRAKNANRDARDLLETNTNAVVRANAARLLGAAEDKEAFDLLVKAATSDPDPRVRVSAIRSLAAFKDTKAADALLRRGAELLKLMNIPEGFVGPWYRGKPRQNQPERNEILEIAAALARILPNTDDPRAVEFLNRLGRSDRYTTPEVLVALANVSPKALEAIKVTETACNGIGVMPGCDRYSRNQFLALAEFAKFSPDNDSRKRALTGLETPHAR